MTLGDLAIGSKVKFGRYDVSDGTPETIIWLIADRHHTGYPSNSITLIAEACIDKLAFDAKEPENDDTDRQSFGNNDYSVSNIDQWMNSDVVSWYTARHTADHAPDEGYVTAQPYTGHAGFLRDFSDSEKNALMQTDVRYRRDGITIVLQRKVFLASEVEVGLTNITNEGSRMAIFNSDASRIATVTTQTQRENSDGGTAGTADVWWLRTANPNSKTYVWAVSASGASRSGYYARTAVGIRPVVNLSDSLTVSDTVDTDGCYTLPGLTPPPEPPEPPEQPEEFRLESLNTFSVRYEVLRNKAVYAVLNALTDFGEVTCDSTSELKMSFRGTFAELPPDVNFLTDRLRPVVILNGEEFSVGVYAITTESERNENGETVTELEGYSLLYLASRKCIETRLSIPAGTNYISECVQLLNSAGITDIDAEPTGYTLATAREDWDVGTPVLTIVNDLLAEISYNSAWVALDGTVRLTKYAPPSLANVDHVYSEGKFSVIEDGYTRSSDRYGRYNVFLVTCENPDLSAPMSATAVNDSEESPFSTAKLGRILRVETVDNIPSQAALQEYANRMKYQSMQETETITFATAQIPNHETFDVVALGMGDLTGIYAETGWTLPLVPGGPMSHTARRVRSV